MNSKGIGIFDSGVGGLTVCAEIHHSLPGEDIHYFGDLARVPYGNKSPEYVRVYSNKIADFLLDKNIKILVIACNTATAHALTDLQKRLNIPVIGVIEPGVKAALDSTKNNTIGVVGTLGTIHSKAYMKTLKKYNSFVDVTQKACPLFVPIIEEGLLSGKITDDVIEYYLRDFVQNMDTLILGCTHYPLLKESIKKNIGSHVTLIDSAKEISKTIKGMLQLSESLSLNTQGKIQFYVSDNPSRFLEFLPILKFSEAEYELSEVSLD